MNKILATSESRWLIVSNLPKTASEQTIKEYFQRHGHIQSIHINDQSFAVITFSNIHTAIKAHNAENILDEQKLRTEYYNGLHLVPKLLSETSSSRRMVTHEVREKSVDFSPEENTRYQVVPIKHDSIYSSGNPPSHSKTTIMKSSEDVKLKQQSSNSKTRILKIYHLPSNMSTESLRHRLRNIFTDFPKFSHLLSIKISNDYALLTFQKSEDVKKALLFIKTKSINGIRLKAEVYKKSDQDLDEYSTKATRTLYIGNLQSDVSTNELREIYSKYGDIFEIEIKRQQQQIFAFIQYTDIKSVIKVIKAFQLKNPHNHRSIKLGFGKSQPSNIIWLDNLSSDVTESSLRTFLNRVTNVSSDEIRDIYFIDPDCSKTKIVQCLIHFIDMNTAQNVMNLIRGKHFESKRIQIDFASTKFSDFIQQTNQNKNHHSSLSNNHQLINSDTNETARSERIFDWLRHNHHSNTNDEEPILTENKKESNQIRNSCNLPKRIFQTKNIPLQSDSSSTQTDIRLKVYSSSYIQSIHSMHLLLPSFAKSTTIPNILNPKAHLKHLSSELINTKKDNEVFLIQQQQQQQQREERRRLLDKQFFEINQDSTISTVRAQQSLPNPVFTTSSTKAAETHDFMSSTLLISPTSVTDRFSLSTTTDKPLMKLSSLLSDIDISSPSKLSMKHLERLESLAEFKHKSVPSTLSAIPMSSNTNDSSDILTPDSTIKNPTLPPPTCLSDLQKQFSNNSPKLPILKSILKQPSTSSQSRSNERRKTVHIVSTTPSSHSTLKRSLSLDDQKKSIIQNNMLKLQTTSNKSSNQSMTPVNAKPLIQKVVEKPNPKLLTPVTNKSKLVKGPLISAIGTKASQIPAKQYGIKPMKTLNQLKQKLSNVTNKRSSLSTLNQQKKPSSLDNHIHKKQPLVSSTKIQKLVINSNLNNNIKNKSSKTIVQNKSKLKQNISMYDRIKKRTSKPQTHNSLLAIKHKHTESMNSIQLKRHSVTIETSASDDNISMKTINIFDTKENKDKINEQQSELNSASQKRPFGDEPNESLKKVKSSSINEEQTIECDISAVEITISDECNTDLSDPQSITINNTDVTSPSTSILEINETTEQNDPSDFNHYQQLKSISPVLSQSSPDISTALNDAHIKTISTTNQQSSTTVVSPFPAMITNELTRSDDSRPHKYPSISQILSPDNNLFTPPHHQHFTYPLFMPTFPESPPLSASNCSSIISNPFYNIIFRDQHNYDQESRRNSLTNLLTTSPSFRNPSELYTYSPQILNSYSTDYFYTHHSQYSDPYNIEWEGYLILKTDHARIKTQLIAGNPQIARISINYWNSNFNHNLRISQRMRLDEIQLDGVEKRMQMTNDHCILIAQPNGFTPDEIHLEENHLKNGFIQYLIEKQAAGIINILLPGVIQPVYVVHIFPPCKFASEILQKRAPDAFRCIVQNKIEQIYLLFIITSTIQ